MRRSLSAFGDHGGLRPGRNWRQQVFLPIDERGGVVAGHLKAVPVSDGVGRAGLYAVTAENAAVVVDVISLCVALAAADAHLVGILGRFDINAVGGTCSGAKETGYAFLETVLVALQDVNSPVALLQLRRLVRI